MTIGIYKITNIINGKSYIGQSTNIEFRWQNHRSELRNNRHYNTHLQNSWNKYGEENFTHCILEECSISDIDGREIALIEQYNTLSKDNGFNILGGGQSTREIRQETRDKMSIKQKGENNPASVITEDTAKEIIKLLVEGKGNKEIANIVNVEPYLVSHIRSKRSWTYLTEHLDIPKGKYKRLSQDTKSSIISDINAGTKVSVILNKYNVGYSTFCYIRNSLKEVS